MSKVFTAKGLLLLAFAFLLASCGSDNQNNQQSKEPLRLNVQPPAAYIDDPYNYALSADGGVRPYRYIMDGNLPKGLSYADGRLSGTPQEKGTYELTFTVEDSNLSSRVQKATLTVGDTPPPQLEVKYPLAAEVDAPFVYAFNIRARESKAFRLQIPLKDLKPTLDSLKANENLIYVIRYDEAKGLVDIDAVFTQPRKDLEAFRINFAPLEGKKVKPQESFIQSKIVLFDRKGQMVVNSPSIQRTPSQGKYKYADLETIARNWGRKADGTQAAPSTPTPTPVPTTTSTPAQPTDSQTKPAPDAPAQPATDAPKQPAPDTTPPKTDTPTDNTDPAQPTTPTTDSKTPAPAEAAPTPPETTSPTAPAKDATSTQQPEQTPNENPATPAETKSESPTSTTTSTSTTEPAKDVTATPQTPTAQTQPTEPNTTPQTPKPDTQTKSTSGLEGDLNGDGSVDQKDLEALRASYTWENVNGGTPPNPSNNSTPQAPKVPENTNPNTPTTTPPKDPATPNPDQP